MDLFVCQTGKPKFYCQDKNFTGWDVIVWLLCSLPWVTQAWELEWRKGVKDGSGRGGERKKSLEIFWLEWKGFHDVLLPPHCILLHITHQPGMRSLCSPVITKVPAWGTNEEQKCGKGGDRRQSFVDFPGATLDWQANHWRAVAEPLAWTQNRMFISIEEKKTNPNQKRTFAFILFYH